MQKIRIGRPFIFLFFVLSCAESGPPPLPPADQVKVRWERWAQQKNDVFKESDDSPLSASLKERFAGLYYFPFNASLVFMAKLNVYTEQKKLRMATSTGVPRDYMRYGYVEFMVEGERQRLPVYKSVASHLQDHLFLPFKDTTNGEETYGAGRYLELESRGKGYYILDFNYAYNPYCVYNERYSCPIPPAENHLFVPIRAGEKNFVEK